MPANWTDPRTWVDLDLVTAADLNEQVRDNLLHLKARPVARASDYDGTVSSTSSTSFVDVTGASVSITTSGSSRLLILASGTWANSGLSESQLTVDLDGTNLGDATYGMNRLNPSRGDSFGAFSITHLTSAAVSNAAHTVKLLYKTNSGTVVISLFSLVVMEVYG